MSIQDRVLLAVALVVIDLALFVLPLTGLFAAYVLLAKPPWFLGWIEQLYGGPS